MLNFINAPNKKKRNNEHLPYCPQKQRKFRNGPHNRRLFVYQVKRTTRVGEIAMQRISGKIYVN